MEKKEVFNNIQLGDSKQYAGPSSAMYTIPDSSTLYFSYETLVAFQRPGQDLVIIRNYWSNTTGKHLNAIDPNKKKRVDRLIFDRLFHEQFNQV